MSRSSESETLPIPNAITFVATPPDITLLIAVASFCNHIIIIVVVVGMVSTTTTTITILFIVKQGVHTSKIKILQ